MSLEIFVIIGKIDGIVGNYSNGTLQTVNPVVEVKYNGS